MRWAIMVSAYSSMVESGRVAEYSSRYMMGESAGFTFWNEGGVGMPGGICDPARVMAVCTSWAAPSRERSSANCRVIEVLPRALVELMLSRPAMVENWRSRGMATAEAMVSG